MVHRSIDFTFNEYEDHSPVAMKWVLEPGCETPEDLKPAKFKVNKLALQDAHKCKQFQARMWEFQRPANSSHDEWLEELNEHTRFHARAIFGDPVDAPRKKWISQESWQFLRLIAPARRAVHRARVEVRPHAVRGAIRLWQVAFLRGRGARFAPRHHSVWVLIGEASDCCTQCQKKAYTSVLGGIAGFAGCRIGPDHLWLVTGPPF